MRWRQPWWLLAVVCSRRVVTFCLCSNTDVHTVASLLKLYLRELPEPVVPFQRYGDFLACSKLLGKDDEMVRNEMPFTNLSIIEVRTERLSHKSSKNLIKGDLILHHET